MKAHALVPGESGPERLVGRVLCHDVRDAVGRVVARKGDILDEAAAARLLAPGAPEIHVLELEPGDLHEAPAGERLARAVAGEGVEVKGFAGGQWSLAAASRGLLAVRSEALDRVNALEGISVYTLYHDQVVEAGEVVAKAKVTPLAIAEALVQEAEARCRAAGGLVAVRRFRRLRVGAVAKEELEAKVRERFRTALAGKLDWFGSELVHLAFVAADPEAMADAIRACRARGADLVVAVGANALDPLDPILAGLDRLGGRMARVGVPAHPGSLLWLCHLGEVPVLGMPSCGMFSQATVFDLLLPRLLAGERLTPADLAGLGHGGLLGREMAFRFPPYRGGQARGELPE